MILVVKGRGHLLYPETAGYGVWNIELGIIKSVFQVKFYHSLVVGNCELLGTSGSSSIKRS
jgi:hypothetical protein